MPSAPVSAVERRAERLDTIAAVLPMDRRDRLAGILTDEDVETLRHLVNEGMGENTLRALTSDLAYLEAWSMAATGSPLPFPAPEALLLKFVAHHLWRPQQREIEPDHGMPADVEEELRQQGFLRVSGPHAPATGHRPPPPGQLVDADPLARAGRRVLVTVRQIGHPACSARPEPAQSPQECQCDYRRYSGQAARNLFRRGSNRAPRPGDPDGSLCLGRAQTQRSGRLARRTAGQTGTGHR